MTKAVQLAISINGTSLSIDKKNLVSLNVKRIVGDMANTFTLEVFDETAFQVENLFNRTSQDTGDTLASITVQYSAANDLSKSIIFSGIVLTYNVSFVGRATMLSIEGVLTCGIDAESTVSWWFKKQSVCWANPDAEDSPVVITSTDSQGNSCLKVKPTELFKRILTEYGKISRR